MHDLNILTRRAFMGRGFKLSAGIALSTLLDIPLVLKRALAEGSIGLNGKKVLFIFLRGANDAVNAVIPIQDSAYATARPTGGPNIGIPTDSFAHYDATTGGCPYPDPDFALHLQLRHSFRQRLRGPSSVADVPGTGVQQRGPGPDPPGRLSEAIPVALRLAELLGERQPE